MRPHLRLPTYGCSDRERSHSKDLLWRSPPFRSPRQMLSQTREEQPVVISDLSAGVTNIRFYRVMVSNAVIGIHLQP